MDSTRCISSVSLTADGRPPRGPRLPPRVSRRLGAAIEGCSSKIPRRLASPPPVRRCERRRSRAERWAALPSLPRARFLSPTGSSSSFPDDFAGRVLGIVVWAPKTTTVTTTSAPNDPNRERWTPSAFKNGCPLCHFFSKAKRRRTAAEPWRREGDRPSQGPAHLLCCLPTARRSPCPGSWTGETRRAVPPESDHTSSGAAGPSTAHGSDPPD